MKIVITGGYSTIPKIITLLQSENNEFRILTGNSSMKKVFTDIYGSENVQAIPERLPTLSKSVLRTIRNIKQIKKNKSILKSQCRTVKGEQVYFFGVGFSELELWLARYLSKDNEIYYCPAVGINSLEYSMHPLILLRALLSWLIYGIVFVPKQHPSRDLLAIRKPFLRSISAKEIDIAINHSAIDKVLSDTYGVERNHILLLVGGIVEDGFVDIDEYTSKMDVLIDTVVARYGKSVIDIKMHPMFDVLYSREKDLKILPQYLPANLLIEKYDIIIGYNTTTLAEAANRGRLAISLMHYYAASDTKFTNSYIRYLMENANAEINFPDSIDTLTRILNGRMVNTGASKGQ